MKVALDVTSLIGARTGVGTVVDAITQGLGTHPGVDLTALVVSRRAGTDLASTLPPGVAIRRLALPARVCHRLWTRLDHPAVRGFDVVHGPNYVVPPAGGGAELLTIHDMTPWRFPELAFGASRGFPTLVMRAIGRGAHVHTVSHAVAAEVADVLGLSSERIHVLPNGVETTQPGSPAAGRRFAGGHPYVLALGTLEPRKDHPTLVAAFAALHRDHPDLHLVVAGPDGWGVDAYRTAVQAAGLDDAIVRLGFVDDGDKADLLAGASVFAYPSIYEGFGLPPLEAAGAGIPVVATNAGAIAEVMADGALLVDVGDVDALAGALAVALTDEGERVRLIAAGHRRVANYTWTSTVDGLVELYRHLSTAGRAVR